MEDKNLTKNAVEDIKTEFELEREKIQIERARLELDRERLVTDRERWQAESQWRQQASARLIPVSTLVYLSVICMLVGGITVAIWGRFEPRRDDTAMIQALSMPDGGGATNAVNPIVIRRIDGLGRGGGILLLME